MTIGELAKKTNVSVGTIRYYESRGLIAAPRRSRSGYRQYPEEAVAEVNFVRRARTLGFSLREAQALSQLRGRRRRACPEVRQIMQSRLAALRRDIQELERSQRALQRISRSCCTKANPSRCSLLDALETDRAA